MKGQSRLVQFPISFEKDELVKLHPPPDDGNAPERFFKNYINMAVLSSGVPNPP